MYVSDGVIIFSGYNRSLLFTAQINGNAVTCHGTLANWTTNWLGTVMSQQYTRHHAAMVMKNDTFANVKVHGQDQRQAPVYTATPTIYTSPACKN